MFMGVCVSGREVDFIGMLHTNAAGQFHGKYSISVNFSAFSRNVNLRLFHFANVFHHFT